MKKFIFAAFLAIGLVAMLAPQPIFAQEDKPFTIHGEVRSRAEYTNNAVDFSDTEPGGNTDQSVFFPYRFRIAAEGNFTHNVHSWIEFQQDGAWGETGDPRNASSAINWNTNNNAVLYQGNVTFDQLWSKNFSLRIGRQEIVAGNQLLLGNEEFYSGISHDGAVGTWHLKKVNVMVWYTRPNERMVAPADANLPPDLTADSSFNTTSRDTDFLGGYATWTFKKNQILDAYLMDLRDHDTGAITPLTIDTLGARYAHDDTSKDSFIWNIEIAQQFGEVGDRATAVATRGADLEGMAVEGWFGYNWKKGKNVHRVYGRYEMATGDDTSTTDTYEGFRPIFGDNHNRTGRGDWFRLADVPTFLGGSLTAGGLIATSVGYNGFYNDRHEFGAAIWNYTLEEDNGNPNGDNLGSAIDLWYGFNYSRNVNFLVSVSQLSPDDALTGTGAGVTDDSVQRYYAQARLRF
jgi:hypothetical protein